jgi:hypothetical protein
MAAAPAQGPAPVAARKKIIAIFPRVLISSSAPS